MRWSEEFQSRLKVITYYRSLQYEILGGLSGRSSPWPSERSKQSAYRALMMLVDEICTVCGLDLNQNLYLCGSAHSNFPSIFFQLLFNPSFSQPSVIRVSFSKRMNINPPRRKVHMVLAVIALIAFSSSWIYYGGCPLIRVNFDISYTKARNVYFGFEPPFDIGPADEEWQSDVPVPASASFKPPSNANINRTLGIASNIYVIHLPHRTDRRENMERLRKALDLQWTYIDAVSSTSTTVRRIMDEVRHIRGTQEHGISTLSGATFIDPETNETQFIWPSELNSDTLMVSDDSLGLAGSDIWSLPQDFGDSNTELSSLLYALEEDAILMDPDSDTSNETDLPAMEPDPLPLTCAMRNSISGPSYAISLPPYMILTPAKISCWHSHLSAIRRIAEGNANARLSVVAGAANISITTTMTNVGIVLEDDIDMEQDIQARLNSVWETLPSDWDIVFLGDLSSVVFIIYIPRTHTLFKDTAGQMNLIIRRSLVRLTAMTTPSWNKAGPRCIHPSLRNAHTPMHSLGAGPDVSFCTFVIPPLPTPALWTKPSPG